MKNKQKELKEVYKLGLEDYWKDEGMVKHCLKEVGFLIELEDGNIIKIKKPTIKKDFCFGWHTHDDKGYEEADKMVTHARQNEDYFIEQNLRDINDMETNLKNYSKKIWVFSNYTEQTKQSRIFTWSFENHYHDLSKYQNARLMTDKEREQLIEGYKEVKKAFIKRLNAYLKRYGLTKVKSWSYWADA